MDYEWDEAKRLSNLAKHEIDFSAITEFEWSTASIRPSPRGREDRWVAIGYLRGELHEVVFTHRGNRTRIITLHVASRQDRREYGQAP